MDNFTKIYAMMLKRASMKLASEDILPPATDDAAEPTNNAEDSKFPGFVFNSSNDEFVKEISFSEDGTNSIVFTLAANVVTSPSGEGDMVQVSLRLGEDGEPIVTGSSAVVSHDGSAYADAMKAAIDSLIGNLVKLQNAIRTAADANANANGLLVEGDGEECEGGSCENSDEKEDPILEGEDESLEGGLDKRSCGGCGKPPKPIVRKPMTNGGVVIKH